MAKEIHRRSPGHIAFDSDIILEVAQRRQLTPTQVSAVYNFLFEEIKTRIKDPENHVIFLPHIGMLYFKVKAAREYIRTHIRGGKDFKNGKYYREKVAALNLQVDNYDQYHKSEIEDCPRRTIHTFRNIIELKSYRKGRSLAQFEDDYNNGKG